MYNIMLLHTIPSLEIGIRIYDGNDGMMGKTLSTQSTQASRHNTIIEAGICIETSTAP